MAHISVVLCGSIEGVKNIFALFNVFILKQKIFHYIQVAVKIIYGSLVQISRIFYYLNYQDLPEFFEDNIETWMTHFLNLLETDNKLLHSGDDDEPGVLEELKSQICDNIGWPTYFFLTCSISEAFLALFLYFKYS